MALAVVSGRVVKELSVRGESHGHQARSALIQIPVCRRYPVQPILDLFDSFDASRVR